MSKALVVKNADFTTNAVTTVTFSQSVPCTGITFSQNSYTISGYDSVTVEYTLTPVDTTDSVTWASSDTSVVTVSGGTLTVVGMGSATVTATCGGYSASATVSVSISYIPNWKFYAVDHATNAEYVSFGSENRTRMSAYGSGSQAGTYNALSSSALSDEPVIKIPGNTVSITVSRGENARSYFYCSSNDKFFWLQDVACANASYPEGAQYISTSEGLDLKTNQSVTVTVPENVNAFVFLTRLSAAAAEGIVADDYAETLELTITFNAE